MHKLIIEDDEGRTTVVPLVREEISIGRKEGNAIRLTERNVSRRHARLLTRNGAVVVEDLASYTGVRVNGVRIEAPTQVRDGDQVLIGDYKLSVKLDGAEAAPPPRAPDGADTVTKPDVGAAARATAPPDPPPLPDGAPQGPSEAAPTIPLRTLVESTRQSERQPPARLVAVTTSLGGMEFRLDRPSLVIGRTEENDIILNHPSISRHHAKIVRDGERYTVVDLQSANGVRVAGETYDRVDVQPGDVIELGHVKLRLVGPNESWAYDPQEFAPPSRRWLKVGGAAAGVLTVALVVLLATRRGGDAGPGDAAGTAPAGPAAAAPPVPRGPTPQQYFARAETAVQGEKWDDAVTALDLLLNTGPNDEAQQALRERAVVMKKQVDLERRSAELYAAFEEAAKANEPDAALSRFDAIPAASLYKSRAEAALPDVKAQFVDAHLDLADAARAEGHCDEARDEVEKIEQIDPENHKAREILKGCRPKPAARLAAAPAAARPASRASHTTAARGAPAAPFVDEFAPPPSEPPADGPALIRQAREAWLHQECGRAIELSRRALKNKAVASDAHQIIAVCSCSTRDREGAVRSYAHLDARSRELVRTICTKYGIELEE